MRIKARPCKSRHNGDVTERNDRILFDESKQNLLREKRARNFLQVEIGDIAGAIESRSKLGAEQDCSTTRRSIETTTEMTDNFFSERFCCLMAPTSIELWREMSNN